MALTNKYEEKKWEEVLQRRKASSDIRGAGASTSVAAQTLAQHVIKLSHRMKGKRENIVR